MLRHLPQGGPAPVCGFPSAILTCWIQCFSPDPLSLPGSALQKAAEQDYCCISRWSSLHPERNCSDCGIWTVILEHERVSVLQDERKIVLMKRWFKVNSLPKHYWLNERWKILLKAFQVTHLTAGRLLWVFCAAVTHHWSWCVWLALFCAWPALQTQLFNTHLFSGSVVLIPKGYTLIGVHLIFPPPSCHCHNVPVTPFDKRINSEKVFSFKPMVQTKKIIYSCILFLLIWLCLFKIRAIMTNELIRNG